MNEITGYMNMLILIFIAITLLFLRQDVIHVAELIGQQ
jgi:hypothetical protein